MRNISAGNVCLRYYPDGEPWMEPEGTNRFTFGGKERVSLGGLNQYDFGPRLLNAAVGVWGAPDPQAEKFYGISPYSYCAGNPVMLGDPTGCSPIFSVSGKFLGVDENGFKGLPHIVNMDEIIQGLPVEKIQEMAVPVKDIPNEVISIINDQIKTFPSRPDYDGVLTYRESREWYQSKSGEPLYVDISKIDFSKVKWPEKWSENNTAGVNLFNFSFDDPALVYGNITLHRINDNEAYSIKDTYDFDMHEGTSFQTKLRNILTNLGSFCAGSGEKYDIYFYGTISKNKFKQ